MGKEEWWSGSRKDREEAQREKGEGTFLSPAMSFERGTGMSPLR